MNPGKPTMNSLVISFGEEEHSLGCPLGRLEESFATRVLAEVLQEGAIAGGQFGDQVLARWRLVVCKGRLRNAYLMIFAWSVFLSALRH